MGLYQCQNPWYNMFLLWLEKAQDGNLACQINFFDLGIYPICAKRSYDEYRYYTNAHMKIYNVDICNR